MAALHLEKIGVKLTKLSDKQSAYLGVAAAGAVQARALPLLSRPRAWSRRAQPSPARSRRDPGARPAARRRPARRASVVLLEGDLGAGKSELARAVIRSLAGAEIAVPSPTFTLVQTYELPGLEVSHADLYRLADDGEVAELGLDECWQRGALLVEWPERAPWLWPDGAAADRAWSRCPSGAAMPAARSSAAPDAGPALLASLAAATVPG